MQARYSLRCKRCYSPRFRRLPTHGQIPRTAGPTTTKNKSDFILEHPDKPAKEIVGIAKSLGFALTEKYVYTIRSVARSRKQRDELRAAAPPPGEAGSAGTLLVAVAGEVGLGRALEMLKNERQRVLAMLK